MLNRVKGHTAAAIIFSAMAALLAVDRSAAAPTTQANVMVELKFKSAKAYDDPFNQVRLDVVFTDPRSKEFRVPAFWAGGNVWRVRYASPVTGVHHYETHCSDDTDTGLNGQKGTVEVLPYHGSNPLYRHGPLRQSADRRHFEQADGTPFLWLGDTWWMSLCKRLHYPDEFETLLRDRIEKGFNVIQIVAGLYPDMPAFDPRGANEAGFPWTKDYKTIRPEYFDAADRRILKLVDSGLVPCIVGAWGCYFPWTGVERMKQHWRYLVARYGALPVVWCVAGEVNQPFTLSKTKSKDKAFQSEGWTEVARDLHRTDPFHRLVTAHPPNTARNVFTDPSVLDFDMLQTGHSDRQSLPSTIRSIRASRAARPTLPVVIGEVCYEGILNASHDDVQRLMAWASYLSGAAGHTYGANGIWQLNRKEQQYGPSPGGHNWGTYPWDDAMRLPGSRQVGLAKKLLEKYPWWRFEPHPEWAAWKDPSLHRSEFDVPYAAGIADKIRVIYVPAGKAIVLQGLDPALSYKALQFDPRTGELKDLPPISPDRHGTSDCAPLSPGGDWVALIETVKRPQAAVSLHPENPHLHAQTTAGTR